MNPAPAALPPLKVASRDVERVWGGQRLGAGGPPIGERWGAFAGNRFSEGPLDGATLTDACHEHGAALLGRDVLEHFGRRFPILTKLLDTSQWLSVQLHPNDEQARELAGPGQLGKTEAWHLLASAPDAEIILGLKPGVDRERFAEAVRSGRTLAVIARQPATAGDTWFIPAGTVHALGPSIFLYEIQQASDITYRVYDWERPASAGRELHLEQALRCVDPTPGERRIAISQAREALVRLLSCPYFTLDRLTLPAGAVAGQDTHGRSFHALTAVKGRAEVSSATGAVALDEFETVLVPGCAGRYVVETDSGATVMVATAAN